MLLAWGMAQAADPTATCERAADRYTTCVAEILGPDFPTGDRAAGIAACAKDPPTVGLYEACLPRPDCAGFLACLTETVQGAVDAETRAVAERMPHATRAERCATHVQRALRGVALQVVVVERKDPTDGRNCVLGSAPLDTCLRPEEQAVLQDYATQRQVDCEAWPEPLAACILGLPGATGCDPDEHPLWRLPIRLGADGPPVRWTSTVAPFPYDPPVLAWGAGGALVVSDDGGLRVLRDGQEVWSDPQAKAKELHLSGHHLVVPAADGLELREVATGKRTATVLAGVERYGIGSSGAELLVLATDGVLHRVTPSACRGAGRGQKCVRSVPGVPDGGRLPGYEGQVAELGGWLIAADSDIAAFHPPGKPARLELALGDFGAHATPVSPNHLAVEGDNGVKLLEVAACAKARGETELPGPRGCVVAQGGSSLGAYQRPVAGPGGAAFNDHGLEEQTVWLAPSGGWSVKTGGQGRVAVDGAFVYTVSFGQDEEGPVRLLALNLADGTTAWSTVLLEEVPELDTYDAVGVVARDGVVAAWVGDRLFVVGPR